VKNMIVKVFASTALAVAVLFAPTARAAATPSQPAPQKRGGERHPEIRQAIMALERAKAHLEHAAHDFGGHRAEALESVNRAIEQLRLALQYDKK